MTVASEASTPVVLELRALLGGTAFGWTQEAWVGAATSERVAIALPAALRDHPRASGVPLTVFGVASVSGVTVPVPALHAVIVDDERGRRLQAAPRAREIPWVEGLYPDRPAGRARAGRDADDEDPDTGLARDGGAR